MDLSAKRRGIRIYHTGSFFWYWLLYEENGGICIKTWKEGREHRWLYGDKDPRYNEGYEVSSDEAFALGQYCLGLAEKYHDLSVRKIKLISDKYYYELCSIGNWLKKCRGFKIK